jgi:hypothetical protein
VHHDFAEFKNSGFAISWCGAAPIKNRKSILATLFLALYAPLKISQLFVSD